MIKKTFSLSYVVTTLNKLPFFKESINRLIVSRNKDEEIVIVDGGSTDGTRELLQKLYNEGKINQFVSEKDFGEAHGWNKALLMAKGNFIKLITDDDVFDYKGIRACLYFMQSNKDVDIMVTPVLSSLDWMSFKSNLICGIRNLSNFETNREPICTTGLGIMLRSKSIPLLGLMNTSFVWVDFEYLMRVFNTKAIIAYYSNPVAFRLGNESSNSLTFWDRIQSEKTRIISLYSMKQKKKSLDVLRSWKNLLLHTVHSKQVFSHRSAENKKAKGNDLYQFYPEPSEMFKIGEKALSKFLKERHGEFAVSRAR